VLAKSRSRIEAASLQHFDHVAAGQDYDRMTVVSNLPVGPGTDMRRGDQYTELAVAQP